MAAVCKAVSPWVFAEERAMPGEATIASHTSGCWCLGGRVSKGIRDKL